MLRAELRVHSAMYTPLLSECEYCKYDINGINVRLGSLCSLHESLYTAVDVVCRRRRMQVYTRESAPKRRISKPELLSHRLHGVDNTGNVRVWFSEHVLLHVMLDQHLHECENQAVLEIAAGMSGLCGLGVAAHVRNTRVYLSDGHPHCAANLRVCVEMNRQQKALKATTRAMQLLWQQVCGVKPTIRTDNNNDNNQATTIFLMYMPWNRVHC